MSNVYNSYKVDGEWERDLFIESSSFAASALAGVAVVNAGTVALGFLMVATPIGWVGLIVGGVAVAGAAAGSSMWTNSQLKSNSGDWYDGIMSWSAWTGSGLSGAAALGEAALLALGDFGSA